jgi:cobalamin biosynthesis Mg chelatase CobN
MIHSLSLSGFCCDSTKVEDNKFRLIKLYYENLSGERGLTTFLYHENGVMHQAHWELLDGSRSSENYYTYDEEGNLIEKYREFSDSITSTQLYEYDENGNLISEHFNRSDGVTGTTNYEYDKYEKLVKANCNGLAGWFYGVITYEYDANEIKTKGIIEKDEERIGTIYFEYDETGILIKEYWEFPDSWSQTFMYKYEKIECD